MIYSNAPNILEPVFQWTYVCISVGCILKHTITRSEDRHIFSFSRFWHFSIIVITIYTLNSNTWEFYFFHSFASNGIFIKTFKMLSFLSFAIIHFIISLLVLLVSFSSYCFMLRGNCEERFMSNSSPHLSEKFKYYVPFSIKIYILYYILICHFQVIITIESPIFALVFSWPKIINLVVELCG